MNQMIMVSYNSITWTLVLNKERLKKSPAAHETNAQEQQEGVDHTVISNTYHNDQSVQEDSSIGHPLHEQEQVVHSNQFE